MNRIYHDFTKSSHFVYYKDDTYGCVYYLEPPFKSIEDIKKHLKEKHREILVQGIFYNE